MAGGRPGPCQANAQLGWSLPCTIYTLPTQKQRLGREARAKKDQKLSGTCGLGAPSDHGDAGPWWIGPAAPGFGNGRHPGPGPQIGLGVRVSRVQAGWGSMASDGAAAKGRENFSSGDPQWWPHHRLPLVSRPFAGAGPLGLSAAPGSYSAPASTLGLFWGTAVPNAIDACPSSLALGISVRQLLNVPSKQILVIHNVRRAGRMRSTGLGAPQPCSTLCN